MAHDSHCSGPQHSATANKTPMDLRDCSDQDKKKDIWRTEEGHLGGTLSLLNTFPCESQFTHSPLLYSIKLENRKQPAEGWIHVRRHMPYLLLLGCSVRKETPHVAALLSKAPFLFVEITQLWPLPALRSFAFDKQTFPVIEAARLPVLSLS